MDALKLANIPQCLKDLPHWVLWKTVEKSDREATKLPYQISGALAESNSPATWASYDAAVEKFERGGYDGIGFMFLEESGYMGIDLDNCRSPQTGEWAPWAREIIEKFQTYTEVSPSKAGAKLFFKAKNPFTSGKNIKLTDAPNMAGLDKKPAIEIYSKTRYFTTTGWRLGKTCPTIEERQEALDWLAQKYGGVGDDFQRRSTERFATTIEDRAAKYISRIPRAVSGQNGSKPTFYAACCLIIGFGLSIDEAYPIMDAWSQECTPPWSERELRHKLEDADRQGGPRGFLRDANPHQWDRIRIPNWKEPKRQPEIKRTTLRQASYDYIEREEKGGGKLYELGLPDLDYAIGGGVEAGEMIVFAARPSHGKSMAAQQSIYTFLNQSMPCLMVSEEMCPLMLGKRVNHYVTKIPKEHWQHRAEAVRSDLNSFWEQMADCYIVENCRTTQRIAQEVEKHVKEDGVKFVAVDYAQNITAGLHRRYEDLTEVSKQLKQIAKDNNVPMLVLCQMSRHIESRTSFTPVMSDLKESGQFEQDADVIVFQVWPHRLDATRDPSEYLMYVAKVRNREINQSIVNCRFTPSRQMLSHSQASEHNAELAFDAAEAFPQKYGFSPDPML